MANDREEDTATYGVVINHEEQYSIWPIDRQLPRGWRLVGKQGSKAECLSYIDEVWTDMRPLSLRRAMEADANAATDGPSSTPGQA
jgi:MbtH protein